ncbi:MAG: hypothetical protein KGH79_00860 [Patescibacteria group bacterium]|nr:hypothetical protein [Patescibacteria group bacterium]
MSHDLINTVMALLFAVALVCVGWGMAMYFYEMGSDEGKKEYKGLLLNSVSALVLLMIIYAVLEWLRGAVGGFF